MGRRPWLSAIELKGVSAGYGETVVLEDINLAVAPGESLSVIGRNGVGKTTLLATIMGHTTLHRARSRSSGSSLNRVPVYRRAAAGLGFVPQEREIFPSLSVQENLDVGARARPLDAGAGVRAVPEPQGAARPTAATSFPAASSRCSRSRARC